VSRTVFILPSVLWRNRQTITNLVLRPKPRNRHGDFVDQITKLQLSVCGPNQETRSSGFEVKPQESFDVVDITFCVVDMAYPYNAIFWRGLLNTFKAVLHSTYLYLKVLATFNIISVFGSQQHARNIEKGFTPGHKNVHFL
jgi:hypothetical protein